MVLVAIVCQSRQKYSISSQEFLLSFCFSWTLFCFHKFTSLCMYILTLCFVQVVSVFIQVVGMWLCRFSVQWLTISMAVVNCEQGLLQLHIAQDVLKEKNYNNKTLLHL